MAKAKKQAELKQSEAYFKKYPAYNAIVHTAVGLGLGILISRPYIQHPIQWGLALVLFGVLGHIYPLIVRK